VIRQSSSRGQNGIVKLAMRLFSVTPNSAGCEHVFSGFGIIHVPHHNKLNHQKVHNAFMVKLDIQQDQDISRKKRKFGSNDLAGNPTSTSQGPSLRVESPTSPSELPVVAEQLDDDPTDFCHHAAELVLDALESDQPEEDETPLPPPTSMFARPSTTQPSTASVPASILAPQVSPVMTGTRCHRKFPLATLFDYTVDSSAGVGFYWKGGLKNMDELEQMHDDIQAVIDNDLDSTVS